MWYEYFYIWQYTDEAIWNFFLEKYDYDSISLEIIQKDKTSLKPKIIDEELAYEQFIIMVGKQLSQEKSFTFVQQWLMKEPYVLWKLLHELEPNTLEYNNLVERYKMIWTDIRNI
jgi:hypothetical protein